MFRKIVSNLPFSSSLIEQLSWYAKKLKNEQHTRRIGLIFLFLTIFLQTLIFIQPPESANASENITNLASQSELLKSQGLTLHINATNITQGFEPAQNSIAEPDEQIIFTLHLSNQTDKSITTNFSENISDILEYSELIDDGGAVLNSKNILTWPQSTIESKSNQTRTFRVKLFNDIPATPSGINNTTSYDCKMSLIFGDNLNIKVNCPAPKIIENIVSLLPNIKETSSIVITATIFLIILFFYFRNKQMQKEIQIIRNDINSGII